MGRVQSPDAELFYRHPLHHPATPFHLINMQLAQKDRCIYYLFIISFLLPIKDVYVGFRWMVEVEKVNIKLAQLCCSCAAGSVPLRRGQLWSWAWRRGGWP